MQKRHLELARSVMDHRKDMETRWAKVAKSKVELGQEFIG